MTKKQRGHQWQSMHINPQVNGFTDNPEDFVVFDIWTSFRQCKVCGRLEEIDRDASCVDSKGKRYEFEGWFVVIPGDIDRCGSPHEADAWHVYRTRTSKPEYVGWVEHRYRVKDTTSTSYDKKILQFLVDDKTYKKLSKNEMFNLRISNGIKDIKRHANKKRYWALLIDVLAITDVWRHLSGSVMDVLCDKAEAEYFRKSPGEIN